MEHVSQVLQGLHKHGLYAKAEKCEFHAVQVQVPVLPKLPLSIVAATAQIYKLEKFKLLWIRHQPKVHSSNVFFMLLAIV